MSFESGAEGVKLTGLVAERVSRAYGRGMTRVAALREVDVKLSRGELVALVGPSGSGKSTLIHLMGFIDNPDGGWILLDGTMSPK